MAAEAVDPFACPIPGISGVTRQPAEKEKMESSAIQPSSERPAFSAPPTGPTSSVTIGQAGTGGAPASSVLPTREPSFVASDDVTAGVLPLPGNDSSAVDGGAKIGRGAGADSSVVHGSSTALRGGLTPSGSVPSPASPAPESSRGFALPVAGVSVGVIAALVGVAYRRRARASMASSSTTMAGDPGAANPADRVPGADVAAPKKRKATGGRRKRTGGPATAESPTAGGTAAQTVL